MMHEFTLTNGILLLNVEYQCSTEVLVGMVTLTLSLDDGLWYLHVKIYFNALRLLGNPGSCSGFNVVFVMTYYMNRMNQQMREMEIYPCWPTYPGSCLSRIVTCPTCFYYMLEYYIMILS